MLGSAYSARLRSCRINQTGAVQFAIVTIMGSTFIDPGSTRIQEVMGQEKQDEEGFGVVVAENSDKDATFKDCEWRCMICPH